MILRHYTSSNFEFCHSYFQFVEILTKSLTLGMDYSSINNILNNEKIRCLTRIKDVLLNSYSNNINSKFGKVVNRMSNKITTDIGLINTKFEEINNKLALINVKIDSHSNKLNCHNYYLLF